MSFYLNTRSAYENFKMLLNNKFYVDKSNIIEKLNEKINTSERFICITKPRRFGKTSILNMLGAYYCKSYKSKNMFDRLSISKSKNYLKYLNQYNVINISLNKLPQGENNYKNYIKLIKKSLKEDILESYPRLKQKKDLDLPDLLESTQDKFIFIIDEWDYIFSHNLYEKNQGDFLEFIRNLLKDKAYVSFVYMTGVLPIKRYSTGSALNMFREYTMLNDGVYANYFGFTEDEIKMLCSRQDEVSEEEISEWYNGYITKKGIKIYNPRSVVSALDDGECRSYWTTTGKMDEVLFFLKYNINEVREDVIKLVNNEEINIIIETEYTAGQGEPQNREEIYSAMIIYGLLAYYDETLKIPNKELMIEFQKALKDESFGYVANLVKNSNEILKATINKDGNKVADYLHDIHNSELPILQYNNENSLSCIITLAYLAARDKYKIEREEKTGKGYCDFIFYPRRKGRPGIIIELKADSSAETAINQIREKEYVEKLKKEKIDYILLVGINYDSRKKEHQCKIEEF